MSDETISEIYVSDVISNTDTGYIALIVKMRHRKGNATWYGPEKKYGVDATVFLAKYGGDIEIFKAWVAEEHRKYTGTHEKLSSSVEDLRGKVIG